MGGNRRDVNIYQACSSCDGTGLILAKDSHGYEGTYPCICKLLRVVETGLSVDQVDRLVLAERARQGDPAAKGE